MKNDWYCRLLGSELGPLSWAELCAMVRDQSLIGDDLVRQGEEGEWTKANLVNGLLARAETAPPHPSAPSGDRDVASLDLMSLENLDDEPVDSPDCDVAAAEITNEIADSETDSMPQPAVVPIPRRLPTAGMDDVFSRSRDVIQSLSRRNQALIAAGIFLVIGVGWFVSRQSRATYRAAYLEVQRLHRHWQQAQAEPLDQAADEVFRSKLHEQRQRVVEQLAGVSASSAGGAVRDAATLLGELIELSDASENATDRSQKTAIEKRFHDSMRQARQGLFDE